MFATSYFVTNFLRSIQVVKYASKIMILNVACQLLFFCHRPKGTLSILFPSFTILIMSLLDLLYKD